MTYSVTVKQYYLRRIGAQSGMDMVLVYWSHGAFTYQNPSTNQHQ